MAHHDHLKKRETFTSFQLATTQEIITIKYQILKCKMSLLSSFPLGCQLPPAGKSQKPKKKKAEKTASPENE